MRKFSLKAALALLSLAAVTASPFAAAVTVHHYVITQTSTGMISTVYDTPTHVYAVNPFVNSKPVPVVVRASTTTALASDGKSVAWMIDKDSYPESIPQQTDADGNILYGNNIIGLPQMPPNMPYPGYSGPVIQTYITYGQNGQAANTVYVMFWYDNGLLNNITTNTAPPPASGGNPGCGGSGQRPCPDPN